MTWCFEKGELTAGMKLTRSVNYFMSLRGYLHESFTFGHKAVEAARKEGKADGLAWLLVYGIGWHEIHVGDVEKGEALMREGHKIYEDLKDSQGIIEALRSIGTALRKKDDFDGARQYYEKGLALAKSLSDELSVALFKRGLSFLVESQGKLLEAKDGLESIIATLRKLNKSALASTLGSLAEVNRKLQHYETAYKIGSEGLELAKQMLQRDTIARISLMLAKIEIERGNYLAALSFAQQALEFYEKSGLFFEKIEEVKTFIKELQEKLTA